MRLDLTQNSLASRQAGNEQLKNLLDRLSACRVGEVIIIDLGDQLATVSWLDGFIVGLLNHLRETESACRALVVSASEETREHIDLILERRNFAIFAVHKIEDLTNGYVTALGHISDGSNEVLATIQRMGEPATADIAEALGTTVQAMQQRLNVLLELGLVHREKFGRTNIYSLPVLHAASELLALA